MSTKIRSRRTLWLIGSVVVASALVVVLVLGTRPRWEDAPVAWWAPSDDPLVLTVGVIGGGSR